MSMRIKWATVLILSGYSLLSSAADLPAVLAWDGLVTLSTPVSGVVVQVDAVPGQEVPKGAILASLDSRRAKAELAVAEARVVEATERLAEAEKELGRNQELFDNTLVAIHEVDLSRIAKAAAATRLREAEAARTEARLQLEYSRVVAPFSGRVVKRHVEPGQTVVSRLEPQPIVSLADGKVMRAVTDKTLDVPVGSAATVRVGQRSFDGTVQGFSDDPGRPGFWVRFSVPSSSLLSAGQPAMVSVP